MKLIQAILAWLAGFWKGVTAQRTAYDEESLKDAEKSRKIDDAERGLDDAQLDERLRHPGSPR